MSSTNIPFNDAFNGFPVSLSWEEVDPSTFDMTDPDNVKLLEKYSQSSGLTKVKLPCYGKYYTLDLTGTTNGEAFKKLLNFYKRPGALRSLGDHIYFEGFHKMQDGTCITFFGS